MEIRIVDAAPRHLSELEALEQNCFSMPWTREQLEGQLPDEHHVFLAALDPSDMVLGYVGMMFVLDEGYISNVAVAQEARRKGIGDALISALLQRARDLKLAFVTLEVRESNRGAIALYLKHGFAPVGRRKGYYDAPKEDALLMTCTMKRGMENENSCV